jgi:uncharacterized membrane protein
VVSRGLPSSSIVQVFNVLSSATGGFISGHTLQGTSCGRHVNIVRQSISSHILLNWNMKVKWQTNATWYTSLIEGMPSSALMFRESVLRVNVTFPQRRNFDLSFVPTHRTPVVPGSHDL